jgi:hypothetical protein
MKRIRLILIVLAAPALTAIGLHELGGGPIFKGYDAGFSWRASPYGETTLSLDAEGTISCWLLLKTAQNGDFSARTSNGIPLRTYQDHKEGSYQWLAVVKEGGAPQLPFEWQSGGTLLLNSKTAGQESLRLEDWYVFPTNKSFDSKHRAKWRRAWVCASWVLLALALCGVILEAIDRVRDRARKPVFTPQVCLQQLIESVDGQNEREAEEMRKVLERVLIHGVSAREALSVLPVPPMQRVKLWFRAASQFRDRLQNMIDGLDRYRARLAFYE